MTTAVTARADEGRSPAHRVVLLGASNLWLSLATVVETASRIWGRPLDVLAACGHGRSYGLRSTLLWLRDLPGIVECGLWPALAQRPPAATAVLLTDVGNDLVYDAPVADILGWVEACLDRLQRAGARVVLTALPLASISTVGPARYRLMRTLLFPGCRLTYATVLERAHELDRRLRDLAGLRGLALVEHQREWYGLDPIHIRRRHRGVAWRDVLAPWAEGAALPPPVPASLRRWLRLCLLAPERRWVLGRERQRAQPAARLPDGTTLSLY
jgi:hypothetical protein